MMQLFSRIHFCNGPDRAQAIEACADLGGLLFRAEAIPETFYDTGSSKEEAQNSPISMAAPNLFRDWLTEKFSDRDNVSKTIWSEVNGEPFQFGVSENRRKFRGAYFCHLKAPLANAKVIEKALVAFAENSAHDIIVANFISRPPLEFQSLINGGGKLSSGGAAESTYNKDIILT